MRGERRRRGIEWKIHFFTFKSHQTFARKTRCQTFQVRMAVNATAQAPAAIHARPYAAVEAII